MRTIALLAFVAAFTASGASAQGAGDLIKGKSAFAVCAVCHSDVAGKNGIGPSLFGVVGRDAGLAPGFKYSAAMKAAGKWTPEKLDAFIAAPKTAVPGTTMPFGGLKDATKRAELVAYLATLK
jgi:cytochrome c